MGKSTKKDSLEAAARDSLNEVMNDSVTVLN